MNIIKFSPEFGQWLAALRDLKGKVKIIARLERAAQGNFGDAKSLGGGLHEMRVLWPGVPHLLHPAGRHRLPSVGRWR